MFNSGKNFGKHFKLIWEIPRNNNQNYDVCRKTYGAEKNTVFSNNTKISEGLMFPIKARIFSLIFAFICKSKGHRKKGEGGLGRLAHPSTSSSHTHIFN